MGQTGRADLLRALARCGATELVIEDDGQTRWAYRLVPKPVPASQREWVQSLVPAPVPVVDQVAAEEGAEPVPQAPAEEPAANMRLPLRMPGAWVMAAHPARDVEAEVRGLPLLTPDDLAAPLRQPAPYRDLVPWARALPGVRRHSDAVVDAGIDWPRLLDHLAQRRLLARLSGRTRSQWPQMLVLALDFEPRLDPFRHDFHRLAQQCSAHLPSHALSVRVVRNGPDGGWRHWVHPRQEQHAPYRPLQLGPTAWQVPPGATVILASDLGAYTPARQPEIQAQWLAWGQRLRHAGARVIVLAPVGPGAIGAEALKLFEVVRWSPGSRWQRERRAAPPEQAAAQPADTPLPPDPLDQLLAMSAPALRIDPPLLRAWCRLLVPGGDASLEGRLWNHPDIERQMLTCSMRADRVDAHLARLAVLPALLRRKACEALLADHAHLRHSMNRAEQLRQSAAVPEEGDAGEAAMSFVRRLLNGLSASASLSAADRQTHRRIAQLIQSAAVGRVRQQDPALFALLDDFLAEGAPDLTGHWQWVQQGARIFLDPVTRTRPGQRLAPAFEWPGRVAELRFGTGTAVQRLRLHDDRVVLPEQWLGWAEAQEEGAELALGPHRWTLRQMQPPPWVEAAELRTGLLFLSHTAPNGQRVEWPAAVDLAKVVSPQLYMGTDAFGLFADVTLSGSEALAFRLRYIPPGRFRMGSPDGVGHDDEHPQHDVLLTEGYWLADTPCTQALWTTVMGKNPSQFQHQPGAADHPVENLSWDDVQTFLQRLAHRLPTGCEPTLPTEAQWEYAARAGQTTAYWWGDEPDDQRANWNGPQNGTTPVNRYPPSPWGLYDMHGNVWEWCLDYLGGYTSESVRDPLGDTVSSLRAVRGGSWILDPVRARSAYRHGGLRGFRFRNQGFRFSLRSPGAGPEPGAGGPATGAGRPGAGGALPRPQDAVAPAQAALDIDLDLLSLESAFEEAARRRVSSGRDSSGVRPSDNASKRPPETKK